MYHFVGDGTNKQFLISDDFELDVEFGNMSSFKMDMSDLDFSSPLKKTEKSKLGKDATPGKLEEKKDKFSFSFDFNELDAFDLDVNLLKGEKKPKNCSECDVLGYYENDASKLPKLGVTNSSNSKDLVSSKEDLDTTNISTTAPADVEQCNTSQEDAQTLPEKQITSTQGEDKTNHSEGERDFQIEYPLTTGSEKPNAQNSGQEFSMQTCDSSPKGPIQQSQNAGPSLATVHAYSGEEKHSTCMISENNSQSGINSPAHDSKGLSAPSTEETMSAVSTPEKNQSDQKTIGQSCVIMHQIDQKNVGHNRIIFRESPEMHKDVENNSEGPVLNETLTSKSNEDKQRSRSKVLKSSLHRYSKSEQLIATKEENNGLKLLSLHKSLASGSRPSSATTLKQPCADLHPAKEKREHSGDNKQNGIHNSHVFKSLNRALKIGRNAVGGDSNHEDINSSQKSLQISPRIDGQVGSESEAVGGLDSDMYLDCWNSVLDEYTDGKAMSLGVPLTIENDGNVEKAEACAKELENICNMLKKKHEEAKELLIRALVNNNSLLMLDHPICEEKIRALQNFAAALLLKK
ncbi:hypothetical protein Taro_008685 [Colocasia esculenta]|uniref:Uncharacterized protein n=1 Tax=Colocasia esculenta TaxID=4460 RepID=A0A843TUD5_COLES|nr:hypothetical protein [Colocasia esculenta]